MGGKALDLLVEGDDHLRPAVCITQVTGRTASVQSEKQHQLVHVKELTPKGKS